MANCGDPDATTGSSQYSRALFYTPGWYRGQYSNNVNCSYTLKLHNTQQNRYLRIKLQTMQMRADRGCNNDYLIIYDAMTGKMMGKFCGSSSRNSLITVPSTQARVVFVTDQSGTNRGAKLKFWSVASTQQPGVFCGGSSYGSGHCVKCGGALTAASGYIRSIYLDQHEYPNNMFCEWTISTNSQQFLRLTFEDLDLETNERCVYDHVQIYQSTSNIPLATVCGNTCTPAIIIPSDAARVTFTTDLTLAAGGFSLNYDLVPSSKFLLYIESQYSIIDRADNSENNILYKYTRFTWTS